MIRRQDVWPLSAVAVLLVATAGWWALALWPLPDEAPLWLARARWVCFNAPDSGLPDRSGWILLVGQPLGMVALLVAGWGRATAEALGHLRTTAGGRLLAVGALVAILGGLGAAGARVAGAAVPAPGLPPVADLPDTYPRLDRAWPDVEGLVDQDGAPFSLGTLGGRRALVTFAFGHCETICPLVVANALAAREAVAGEVDLTLVVFTLDPWRDTPSRLPVIARDWRLGDGDYAVSGAVERVEAALDAWNVARSRDERTGDIAHPPLVFLVEADGTVAYAAGGDPAQIVGLARRLR